MQDQDSDSELARRLIKEHAVGIAGAELLYTVISVVLLLALLGSIGYGLLKLHDDRRRRENRLNAIEQRLDAVLERLRDQEHPRH